MQGSTRNIFAIVICVINAFGIIGNAIGIQLLAKSQNRGSSQTKIIASISLVDIVLSGLTLVITVLDFIGRKLPDDNESIYFWSVRTSFYVVWYCMFYLLTLERFIGGHFPFAYRRFSSTKGLRNILLGCWTVPIFIGPILCLTNPQHLRIIIDKMIWVSLDSIFIGFFIFTYSSIFYRKYRSSARFGHRQRNSANQRFFGVTTAMLVTFLLFETVPSVSSSVLFSANVHVREIYQLVFELFWSLNLMADPMIYIFLQPRFWKRQMRCCLDGPNRVHDTGTEKHIAPISNDTAYTTGPELATGREQLKQEDTLMETENRLRIGDQKEPTTQERVEEKPVKPESRSGTKDGSNKMHELGLEGHARWMFQEGRGELETDVSYEMISKSTDGVEFEIHRKPTIFALPEVWTEMEHQPFTKERKNCQDQMVPKSKLSSLKGVEPGEWTDVERISEKRPGHRIATRMEESSLSDSKMGGLSGIGTEYVIGSGMECLSQSRPGTLIDIGTENVSGTGQGRFWRTEVEDQAEEFMSVETKRKKRANTYAL